MVILGLGDGVDAGAALVIDDALVAVELQEHHDRVPRSRAFPWSAAEEVLDEAGIKPRHVDEVAIAGQFTPPFFLRRHPGLRRVARDVFSPAVDVQVFYQAMLRQSGIGALEADRVAEWAQARLAEHGFQPQRVTMVDVHKALAEAAYRTQPEDDDVLMITLHPRGDGAAFAVYSGRDGQIDRLHVQRGFASLHVHLQRCAAAIGLVGLDGIGRMWSIAGRGEPDRVLVERLERELRAEGLRFSRRPYPFPEPRQGAVWRGLAEAEPEVAAASVLQNLVRAVTTVVRAHVRRTGFRRLALGGAIFDNPRLCAAVAAIDDIETLWVHPAPGHASLPVGASASLAGLAPHALAAAGLGRQYTERQYVRALSVAGLSPTRPADEAEAAATFLAAGEPVARFQGRSGHGRHGNGTRSLLVRADDPAAIERARTRLRRPEEEEPVALWLPVPGDGRVHDAEKVPHAIRFGSIALQVDATFAQRYPGVVAPDGRARLQRIDDADPGLLRILQALHRRTGCAALACFPLADGDDPVVGVPGDAIRAWRRAGLPVLLLGPFLVQEAEASA